jgi:hypothetical protein
MSYAIQQKVIEVNKSIKSVVVISAIEKVVLLFVVILSQTSHKGQQLIFLLTHQLGKERICVEIGEILKRERIGGLDNISHRLCDVLYNGKDEGEKHVIAA